MNGIVRYILLLFFILFYSNLYSEICWADKVISYSSQSDVKQYSANQALGYPSTYHNKTMPTSWLPLFNSDNMYEDILLGFDCSEPVEYIFINMPLGGINIKSVSIIDEKSNENSILDNKSLIENKDGKITLKLKKPTIIKSIRIFLDLKNASTEVLLDAVGIGNNREGVWELVEVSGKLFESEPENIGSRINSIYSELSPIISAEGNRLFFTRDGHPENIGSEKNQDVWMSELEADGRFGKAINLYDPVNNKTNNFAFSTNSDGSLLLMGRDKNSNSLSTLSYSVENENQWSNLIPFKFTRLYNKTSFVNFSMSQGKNLMFISMERGDSYGGLDLYYTMQTDSGWTDIENLGPSINTAGNEITPFIANDSKTLYFSSDGYPGYGGMDLFVSKIDDSLMSWSIPKNLGGEINSSGWEAYFTISSTSDYAYFVSTTNSIGKEDIFRIKLPKEVIPEKSFIISGKVTGVNKGNPISSRIEFRELETNRILGLAYSDSLTGYYRIALPAQRKYGISSVADGYYSISKSMESNNESKEEEITLNLEMKPLEIGETYSLNNIFFELGKSELDKKSTDELKRLTRFLKKKINIEILLVGFTDEIGTEDDNLVLSKKRAESVYNYLIDNGIDKNRLSYEGKGELKSNKNVKLEMNRKVEFKIIRDNK